MAASDFDTLIATFSPSLFLKLDETTGTTAVDSSGNGLDGVIDLGANGVLGGVPFFESVALQTGVMQFSGGGGSTTVTVPDDALLSPEDGPTGLMTIVFWIYKGPLQTFDRSAGLFQKAGPINPEYTGDNTTTGTGRFQFGLFAASGDPVFSTVNIQSTDLGGTALVDEWHMLAFTYDRAGELASIWLDGGNDVTSTPAVFDGPDAEASAEDLVIGYDGISAFYDGALARWALIPTVLSSTDLQDLFDATNEVPLTPGPGYPLGVAQVIPSARPPRLFLEQPPGGVTVEVLRPPSMSSLGSPDTAHGIEWSQAKNGTGTGQIKVALDDTLYGDVRINDVLRFLRDGSICHASIVEQIVEHLFDADGGSKTDATYSGRGVGAFLEWMLVAPCRGEEGDESLPIEEDSIFDWRSPRYDISDWSDSKQVVSVDAARDGDWPTQPMGQGFTPSTGAYMIWAHSGTTLIAPVGWCLFRIDIDVPTSGRYGLEVLMDNDGFVWIDTVQQLEINQFDGYHRVSFKRLILSGGLHTFAFQVRNIGPIETAGPAALAYNLFKTDQQDQQMPGMDPISVSTSAVQILEYPATFPSMTVGEILLDLLAEGQARGVTPWTVPTFTALADSAGRPWGVTPGITTKTGTTSVLQFITELEAEGLISRWRYNPDAFTWDVWGPGYRTRPGSVEYFPPGDSANDGQLVSYDRTIT